MTETAMATSEVLNRAADLIEERGWTTGTHGWPRSSQDATPLCLEGGILAAIGEDFISVRLDAFWTCPAYLAVQSYLELTPGLLTYGDDGPVEPLWKWNDRGASAKSVIEVLRACAVIEASREREAAEVSA